MHRAPAAAYSDTAPPLQPVPDDARTRLHTAGDACLTHRPQEKKRLYYEVQPMEKGPVGHLSFSRCIPTAFSCAKGDGQRAGTHQFNVAARRWSQTAAQDVGDHLCRDGSKKCLWRSKDSMKGA